MLVTVEVTDADIDGGKPQGDEILSALTDCVVARAIKQLVTTDTKVYVTFNHFSFNRNQYKPLPSGVANKILQWCQWVSGKPGYARPDAFSFQLNIPSQFLKMEIPQEKDLVKC